MKLWKKIVIGILIIVVSIPLLFLVLYWLWTPKPEKIEYGITFSTMYSEELGLDWRQVYQATLTDLEVKRFRIPAYWPRVEKVQGTYSFEELDYQMDQAELHDAKVILAVGRRLPRWPECHIPGWAEELSWEEQKDELRDYIEAVVKRYNDHPALLYWQVENEPYLSVFAHEHCGDLDEAFLKEEITLVKSLDGSHPVLVTDSGNLGLWAGPYRNGDLFGTSLYIYFWNPELGKFKTDIPAWFYSSKKNLMRLMYGNKEVLLIELGLEPWLTNPVAETPLDVQFERMDFDQFKEILSYARRTRFDTQYLWGAEWWYWLKVQHDDPRFWDEAKTLFRE